MYSRSPVIYCLLELGAQDHMIVAETHSYVLILFTEIRYVFGIAFNSSLNFTLYFGLF